MNNFSNILILPKSSELYEAFAIVLLNKLKILESSVVLPVKPNTSTEGVQIKRKNVLTFTESKVGIPFRRISDIRFDDKKFWMELNFVSNSPNENLVNYFEDNTGKR